MGDRKGHPFRGNQYVQAKINTAVKMSERVTRGLLDKARKAGWGGSGRGAVIGRSLMVEREMSRLRGDAVEGYHMQRSLGLPRKQALSNAKKRVINSTTMYIPGAGTQASFRTTLAKAALKSSHTRKGITLRPTTQAVLSRAKTHKSMPPNMRKSMAADIRRDRKINARQRAKRK